MFFNAYATVCEEIPAPYNHQRGLDDPEMPDHLKDFVVFVWQVGGEEMTSQMWAVMNHISQTQRQYVFDVDSIEEFADWAKQVNAIWFRPDGALLNPEGEEIFAHAPVPYHPAAVARAKRVRAEIERDFKARIPGFLPPVRSEFEISPRQPREVAQRFLSLAVFSELGLQLMSGEELPLAQLKESMPDAFQNLNENETQFLNLVESGEISLPLDKQLNLNDASDEVQGLVALALELAWEGQSALMLAYTFGLVQLPEGEVGDEYKEVTGWALENGQDAVYEFVEGFIPLEELCEKYEFIRSLRWVSIHERMRPKRFGIFKRPVTISDRKEAQLMQWHQALAWLCEPHNDWDEIDLSI
ncbi:DUF4272 domain-containing protein [Corynebacterium sp. 3HC-13]|uniref:DUF4272 domain-containing protein n=1 Tax=Corynebacterium poyangense TaxID=2684405 RepID=UPI001CCBD0D8|nr:DUF4272 domain-containing protein [Corynebacterium poyangense]MBZ8176603.1 DUF4272 domain-containing protein [Corynebacterium poyangense]